MLFRCHSDNVHITCPHCAETFISRPELSHHLKSCPNGEKFSCSDCGSSFISQEALSLHIKLHNGDTSLVNDICTLTANLHNASFPLNISGLAPVNNMQMNRSFSNGNKKTHICSHCTKGFSAKHGLQQHKKRHPQGTCALKSHVCPTCGKGFYQKNHLLLHQRLHMDLKNNSLIDNQNHKSNNSHVDSVKEEREREIAKCDEKLARHEDKIVY